MSVKTKAIILFIIMLITGCSSATPAPTLTPLPTATYISPTLMNQELPTQPTYTTIPTYTATVAASAVYYIMVLDASATMNTAFAGKTKWEAAQTSVQKILESLGPGANYGLITIGASPATDGVDPCLEPSVARTPFSTQKVISDQLGQLQPVGSGSLYTAVRLALRQFEVVPDNSVRVLIVISGAADGCQRDEWSDLEQQFKVNEAAGVNIHSEMIVLDETVDPKLQTVTDRMIKASKSKNVQIKFATDAASLDGITDAVAGNVKAFVEKGLATRPTEGVLSSSFTLTPRPGEVTSTPGASSFTLTPIPGALTATLSASSYTLTPRPGTATFTPTNTFTPVPVTFTETFVPTITRTPTATLAPSVALISANPRTTGIGCQMDITVKVSGSPATGSFHVMNSSNTPTGEIYLEVFLPVGTFGNNTVTLDGNQPSTYKHEVWFEYSGVQSNHLTGLLCPLLPKTTPTP